MARVKRGVTAHAISVALQPEENAESEDQPCKEETEGLPRPFL